MPSTIIPTMRYDDASAAIVWLCNAFGFGEHFVVRGEGDAIAHAQLTFDGGMIMLASARGDEYGGLLARPGDAGGVTQAPYIIVGDVDAHCARARAAGAEIVSEPAEQPYGGKHYACRDPEKHLWNFGSYDPWAG